MITYTYVFAAKKETIKLVAVGGKHLGKAPETDIMPLDSAGKVELTGLVIGQRLQQLCSEWLENVE